MKLAKRLLTAMLALSLVLSMAGCAGSNDKEGSEASKEPLEPSVDIKNSGAETVGSAENEIILADALTVTLTGVETKGDYRLMLNLDVENMSKTNAIDIEWTEISLDNQTISEELWFADHPSQKIEAGEIYKEILYIDEPPADCKEATVKLDATSENGETESLVFPILLSDTNITDVTPNESGHTDNTSVLSIAEQEVYNGNGLRITVPEQKISQVLPSTVEFGIECDWEYGAGLSIREVFVNGELVHEEDMKLNENQFGNNGPYQFWADLGENGARLLLESGSEANEVSINMLVEDTRAVNSEEITIVIPVIVTEKK